MPRKAHVDDLPEDRRLQLVEALRKCIQTGRECGDRFWVIPNSNKEDSRLPTYGFPKSKPRLWLATTRFPKRNTTRDAFLVAVSMPELKPIPTTFEFNIGLRPSNNLNFRLQQGGSNNVIVRCKGSFTMDGKRQPAGPFLEFVENNAVGLSTERTHGKTFVRLRDLPLASVHSSWPRLLKELERLASAVDTHKKEQKAASMKLGTGSVHRQALKPARAR